MLSSKIITLHYTIFLLSLTTIWNIISTNAFSTGQLPPKSVRRNMAFGTLKHQPSSVSINTPTVLYATSITPPEHHDKEKKNSEDDDDWTPIKGGFIPNFLRKQVRPKRNVHLVDTLQDYKNVVVDEAHQLVVVRFFAPWCKSCRASEPHFMKLVNNFSQNVKFVEVPMTKETAFMFEGLGVPTVPFAHIYHPDAGLVEEMRASKKFSSELQRKIDSYVTGSCDISFHEDVIVGTDSNDSDGNNARSSSTTTPTGNFE